MTQAVASSNGRGDAQTLSGVPSAKGIWVQAAKRARRPMTRYVARFCVSAGSANGGMDDNQFFPLLGLRAIQIAPASPPISAPAGM